MQSSKESSATALSGRRIVIPESRQLDILARLIENRGGEALRVPLVAIHDSPDQALIKRWLQGFISSPPALFIVFTGEGLRRLLAAADRSGCKQAFIDTLGKIALLTRGPKPVRVLTDLGLKSTYPASAPTTAGVISTLEGIDLEGLPVAVQLYGEEPNQVLQDYLRERKAEVTCVAPYVYASQSESGLVRQCILDLAEGKTDMIAFTSQPQLYRLQQVAREAGLQQQLNAGLGCTAIAAVGPVVRDQLTASGYEVAVMPEKQFFMKPMVTAMVNYFSQQGDLPSQF